MAAQFDVYLTTSQQPVVIIQSDLLSELRTRAVVLLSQDRGASEGFGQLTPIMHLNGKRYMLEGHTIATLTLSELARRIGSLATQRDKIIRATDALLGGI